MCRRLNPPVEPKRKKINTTNPSDYNYEILCSICFQIETPQDPLYKCSSCGVIVHQSCYYILQNQSQTDWKCDCCKYFDIPKQIYQSIYYFIF